MHRVEIRCSVQKFGLFLIKISASMCIDILRQQLSNLSIVRYLPRKVTLQSRLFSYVMPGCVSEGEWVLCQSPSVLPGFFLCTLFSEQEQKNTSLGEFSSCEIHSGKQSFPLLALAGVLLLCLIRTRINWLLLKAAVT